MSWCTSRMNIVVIVVLSMFVICSESLEEKSSAALFRDVFDFLEQKNDLGELIDLEDDEIRDGVLQIFREHGFDESDLMADGILGGIWNMVFSEDGKRTFAFANLAKQLSCYQGVRGGVFKTLRFAFDKYNDYGCYCGGGQSYGDPVDDTDRCCLDHDNCYGRAMSDYRLGAGCATYTTQYEMECNRRRRSTQCERRGPGAGRALCECDRAMAICVSRPRAIRRYRRNNKNVRTTRKCSVPGKRTSGASNIWELIKSCNFISSNRNAGRPRRPQRRGRRSYRGK